MTFCKKHDKFVLKETGDGTQCTQCIRELAKEISDDLKVLKDL